VTSTQTILQFIDRIKSGESIEFEETLAVIDRHYAYTPARFSNGEGGDRVVSEPGTNVGSLKILSFASIHCLSESQTLELFGKFYRDDVLAHPEGEDHRNIRAFMKTGWRCVHFESNALTLL
jgi:hypothetical protein